MAKETKQVEVAEEEKANRQMPKNRRYVGSRETTAYVLYDIAQSFNLSSKGTYFITDVLVIADYYQRRRQRVGRNQRFVPGSYC